MSSYIPDHATFPPSLVQAGPSASKVHAGRWPPPSSQVQAGPSASEVHAGRWPHSPPPWCRLDLLSARCMRAGGHIPPPWCRLDILSAGCTRAGGHIPPLPGAGWSFCQRGACGPLATFSPSLVQAGPSVSEVHAGRWPHSPPPGAGWTFCQRGVITRKSRPGAVASRCICGAQPVIAPGSYNEGRAAGMASSSALTHTTSPPIPIPVHVPFPLPVMTFHTICVVTRDFATTRHSEAFPGRRDGAKCMLPWCMPGIRRC